VKSAPDGFCGFLYGSPFFVKKAKLSGISMRKKTRKKEIIFSKVLDKVLRKIVISKGLVQGCRVLEVCRKRLMP
jgi:hypothetical protein